MGFPEWDTSSSSAGELLSNNVRHQTSGQPFKEGITLPHFSTFAADEDKDADCFCPSLPPSSSLVDEELGVILNNLYLISFERQSQCYMVTPDEEGVQVPEVSTALDFGRTLISALPFTTVTATQAFDDLDLDFQDIHITPLNEEGPTPTGCVTPTFPSHSYADDATTTGDDVGTGSIPGPSSLSLSLLSPQSQLTLMQPDASSGPSSSSTLPRGRSMRTQRKGPRPLPDPTPDAIIVAGYGIPTPAWARACMQWNKEGCIHKCAKAIFDGLFSNEEVEAATKSGRGGKMKLCPVKKKALEDGAAWIKNNLKDGTNPYAYSDETVGLLTQEEVHIIRHKILVERRNDRKSSMKKKAKRKMKARLDASTSTSTSTTTRNTDDDDDDDQFEAILRILGPEEEEDNDEDEDDDVGNPTKKRRRF